MGINPDLLEKLESITCVFDEEWNKKIDSEVIKHMRRFRDLLRIA